MVWQSADPTAADHSRILEYQRAFTVDIIKIWWKYYNVFQYIYFIRWPEKMIMRSIFIYFIFFWILPGDLKISVFYSRFWKYLVKVLILQTFLDQVRFRKFLAVSHLILNKMCNPINAIRIRRFENNLFLNR